MWKLSSTFLLSSESAIVRASFITLWYARGEKSIGRCGVQCFARIISSSTSFVKSLLIHFCFVFILPLRALVKRFS